MKRFASWIALLVLMIPAIAAGQTSVTVLGLRSAAAEEAVARRVSVALRQAAEESTAFEHTGQENDLAQLLIVFDCVELTPQCLQRIGENLETDRLVHGLIEPVSGADETDYALTLSFFDVEAGEEVRTLQETVQRSISDHDMTETMTRYFGVVTGTGLGELLLICNVSGAQVLVNGSVVGITGSGPLLLEELEPGVIDLIVRHADQGEIQQSATIVAGETVEISVELSEETEPPPVVVTPPGNGDNVTPPPRNLAWLGWSTAGLGVVFGVLGIVGSAQVNGINQNEDSALHLERQYWSRERNICDELDGGAELPMPEGADPRGHTRTDVVDACGSARSWQALQFVFYGLGAAAIGVGIWLIIREMTGQDEAEETSAFRLRVSPMVLNGGGAVSAQLAF